MMSYYQVRVRRGRDEEEKKDDLLLMLTIVCVRSRGMGLLCAYCREETSTDEGSMEVSLPAYQQYTKGISQTLQTYTRCTVAVLSDATKGSSAHLLGT